MFLKNTSHQVCLTCLTNSVDLTLTLFLIGPQPFVNQASAISSTIQELYNRGPSHWVFYHRFKFVTSYAEFQESLINKNYANAAKSLITIISEELAPRAWGAILLNDSIPLLQYSKHIPVFYRTTGHMRVNRWRACFKYFWSNRPTSKVRRGIQWG